MSITKNGMSLTIPGKPIAKARPRFFRRDRHIGSYNPQETQEGLWLMKAKEQISVSTIADDAISIWLSFDMPIPKSTSHKKRALMLNGIIHHTKKPDLDNLIKFALDCLNYLDVWNDDRQIVKIDATKQYNNTAQTVIHIDPLVDVKKSKGGKS